VRQDKGILRRDTASWVYLGVNPPALHYIVISSLYQKHHLMIFEFLFIISHIYIYPYIVHAIHGDLTTPPTETFSDCPEFKITDTWDSLTEEEYIEEIIKNTCQDTDTLMTNQNSLICLGHRQTITLVITTSQEGRQNTASFLVSRSCHHQTFNNQQWRGGVMSWFPLIQLRKRWNNTSLLPTNKSLYGQSSCTID